jgi:hypothetical protein
MRKLFVTSLLFIGLMFPAIKANAQPDDLEPMNDPYDVMLNVQLATRKVGSVNFWEAVAWCETHHGWNTNKGYYSGGLGMAQSVWHNFGGKEFARKPFHATKVQQIIIANRVAFLGYQTRATFGTLDDKLNNRPFFRPAVGWRRMKNWGRNCVDWRTRKPLRNRYTQ